MFEMLWHTVMKLNPFRLERKALLRTHEALIPVQNVNLS
jgi:hypothetical protein